MSRYTYIPIQTASEFRLLELQPGQGADPLYGRLFHANLESPPDFQAISYVWASEVMNFSLETSEGNIPLTASLHSALRRFRKKDSTVVLWADALCIDQNNDKEKGHQVGQMRRIYGTASMVLAHLGGDADDRTWDTAISTLAMMYTASLGWVKDVPATWMDGVPQATDECWDKLADLFGLPWWQRAWIIQEVVVAKVAKLFVGRLEVTLDILLPAAMRCRECYMKILAKGENHRDRRYPDTDFLVRLSAMRGPNAGKLRSLLYLITFFSEAKATRARDHLFALHGLASDVCDEQFDPDYTQPFEVVVKRYAAGFVKNGLTINLLTHAGLRPVETSKGGESSDSNWILKMAKNLLSTIGMQKPDRFPSWIPDWTKAQPLTLGEWISDPALSFKASQSNQAQAAMGDLDDEIIIQGVVTDTVAEIGQFDSSTLPLYLLEIEVMLPEEDTAYPTGESSKDLRWRIPIGNQQHAFGEESLEPENAAEALHSSYKLFMEDFAQKAITMVTARAAGVPSEEAIATAKGPPLPTAGPGWAYEVKCMAFGLHFPEKLARVCKTERGLVGIVPASTKVGDDICVLWGGAAPFVLRKSDQRAGKWRLISECYVHGIMHGEGLGFEGLEEQEFIIH